MVNTDNKFKIIPWSPELDLESFYALARQKGFENNSNQKIMVDCFRKERLWQVWMLYYNNQAVGSVAAHSLDVLGPNSFRICARTCAFTELMPFRNLRSLRKTCQQHQNVTAQFFMPQCIEWAGRGNNLYITSHPSDVGSQQLVHQIYLPALEETGAVSRAAEMEYRGHIQTFWKLNVDIFYDQLNALPRW